MFLNLLLYIYQSYENAISKCCIFKAFFINSIETSESRKLKNPKLMTLAFHRNPDPVPKHYLQLNSCPILGAVKVLHNQKI